MLIVIEGVDGAGKNTLSKALTKAWEADGRNVLSMGFPRYGESVHADLAAEALHGEHGDLSQSVYAMAVLFALDRHGAAHDLRRLINRNDVVLLDRYVASNAAYTAARLEEGADGAAVEWIRSLEFDRLSLPKPDVQVLLDVAVEVAEQRAIGREAQDSSRERDAYERDGGLQRRTADVYRQLADRSWVSNWHRYNGSDATRLAADLLNQRSDHQSVTR